MTGAERVWKFIADPRADATVGVWTWVKCEQGRALYKSMGSFTTFVACVDNARLRGFSITDRFEVIEERRRQPRALA